jgi:hypothetical protein
MTQIRQYWVWVRYKDEPGAGFCKQYVTAKSGIGKFGQVL